MSERKHTQGPWVVEESEGKFFIGPLDRVSSRVEAIVVSLDASKAKMANARLIAAAPDLLEAMQGIDHFSDALSFREDHLSKALRQWIDAGRAAIAKAEAREALSSTDGTEG